MTLIFPETIVCAVCGRENTVDVLASSSAFGASDLDLRPPPLQRYTLRTWLQDCAGCGFVADRLDQAGDGVAAQVRSAAYQSLRDNRRLDWRFQRGALLADLCGDRAAAAERMLWAAWAADDLGDRARALAARRGDMRRCSAPARRAMRTPQSAAWR